MVGAAMRPKVWACQPHHAVPFLELQLLKAWLARDVHDIGKKRQVQMMGLRSPCNVLRHLKRKKHYLAEVD